MTSCFYYRNNELYIEDVAVQSIIQQYGTPCYIYSRSYIEHQWQQFNAAFESKKHITCYAVKANHNLALLNLLAKAGAYFDIVSQGELERVIAAGGDAKKVIYSGVGKRSEEIKRALKLDIFCFNVESSAELERIAELATQLGKKAPIALRVKPNVDAQSHPHIATAKPDSKFGIDLAEAITLLQQCAKNPALELKGIHCHVGSQITEATVFKDTVQTMSQFIAQIDQLGVKLQYINLGGGLGVAYHTDQKTISFNEYATILLDLMLTRSEKLILEPGRIMIAGAGLLVGQVEYIKAAQPYPFAILDTGMSELLRPALYNAFHPIVPVIKRSSETCNDYHIVGPICESSDSFGIYHNLDLMAGDYVAITMAGAYGNVMASNYNSHNRCTEILVDRDQMHVIRSRENFTQQFELEKIPDWD